MTIKRSWMVMPSNVIIALSSSYAIQWYMTQTFMATSLTLALSVEMY